MTDHMTAEQLRAELLALSEDAREHYNDPPEFMRNAFVRFSCKVTEIAARLSGMAAVQWPPIETAPKDGSVIWAFNGEQARMKWVSGDNYALWIWDDCALSDIDPSPEQPTHWMPLPEPPHV